MDRKNVRFSKQSFLKFYLLHITKSSHQHLFPELDPVYAWTSVWTHRGRVGYLKVFFHCAAESHSSKLQHLTAFLLSWGPYSQVWVLC